MRKRVEEYEKNLRKKKFQDQLKKMTAKHGYSKMS
jgi:hypothetical protein